MRRGRSPRTLIAISLLVVASLLPGAKRAGAELVQVLSRTALAGTDYVDWSSMGGPFTNLGDPFDATSAVYAKTAHVSQSSSQGFQVWVDGPGGWSGNFTPGDYVLWNTSFTNNTVNPLSIAIAGNVSAVGTQIMPNSYGSFLARVEAFDQADVSLGFFDVNGVSNTDHDGSAVFLGVRSTSSPIARVQFSILTSPGVLGDFGINRVSFTPFSEAVPEIDPAGMGSVLALVTGALGLLERRRIKCA